MKCSHCRIGHYLTIKMPYITFIDGQMLVMPNVSAYHCDMCGDISFNEAFLERLHYLLDRLTQPEYAAEIAEWLAANNRFPAWQSGGRIS